MAKLTTEEFIEAIKELSVLELNDLVKACEEEFGVSAAAGVVVAAAAEGGAAAEEKDEFDVELVSAGAAKVKVIKVVREVTGLGLKALLKLRLRKSRLNLKQKVLKLTLNNSSLIELSGHSGDGMPFRIIGMLNIRKSLQSGFFLMFSSTGKVLKKTGKNNIDLLDILDKLML